tara:strand:- start:16234 stop:16653 length:420 start_codon:yes stop_codon:yes gene_type:complete
MIIWFKILDMYREIIIKKTYLFLFILPLLFLPNAYSHHSFAAHFDTSTTISIEGVVTEFWFQNPHARVYLEVTLGDGEKEIWMSEGAGPNVLIRNRGWSGDEVNPGMKLYIEGNPARDGSNSIGWRSIRLDSSQGELIF